MHGYSFLYIWGPVFLFITVIVGLIILAVNKFKLFLAIVFPFLLAFVLPFIIVNLFHLSGLLPPRQGGSIPLPNNIVDLFFLIYFIFPFPFFIPTIVAVTLYKKNFSKKFFISKK